MTLKRKTISQLYLDQQGCSFRFYFCSCKFLSPIAFKPSNTLGPLKNSKLAGIASFLPDFNLISRWILNDIEIFPSKEIALDWVAAFLSGKRRSSPSTALWTAQKFRVQHEFNKDKHDYDTRYKNNIRKSASSRNWGHWTLINFASNDSNKLDLSIRKSPSLASFKRALRNANSL